MKTLKEKAVFIAGLLLAMATCMARAAPPPAEVFYKDADIVEAVLSPSGKRLAVTSAKGLQRIGLVVLELSPAAS